MNGNRASLNEIIAGLRTYLKQQAELYGGDIPLKREDADRLNALFSSSPATASQVPVTNGNTGDAQSASDFTSLTAGIVVQNNASEEPDLFAPTEAWQQADSLSALNDLICNCTKCALGATRTKFVFGVGNPNAEVMLIGEAPGADEDAQGEPFVGRAGQLLNKILEAIKFKREEVFIANILKCRPPGNRSPLPTEIDLCIPYLHKQIELLNPKVLLCLGRVAASALLRTEAPLSDLRGKIHQWRKYPVMVTYHPAALLRNPNWKRPTWEDVQKMRALYDSLKAN